MKTTIRILSLVLCLAMLAGIFAVSAFAAEETVLVDQTFEDMPAHKVDPWTDYHTEAFSWVPTTLPNAENQHAVLTHNATEAERAFIGFILPAEGGVEAFERGKIAAKDLTFEAKVAAGTKMRIEFFVMWDLFKADGTTEVVPRRISMDILDGTIINAIDNVEVGKIAADVDLADWNTYTVRVSRQTGYSGVYDVQLLVNGVNYVTEAYTMGTQGNPPAERWAIHARTPGAVEIDNVKFEELYLDDPKGAVTADSVKTVWETGFGALGTELTYSSDAEGNVPGTWKKGTHENTTLTFVEDEAVIDTTASGYLKVALPSTASRATYYGNQKMASILPVGQVFWVQMDAKLDGDEFGFQVGSAMDDKGTVSGRQLYVSIRPDGLYYNTGSEFVKAEFTMPAMTDWTKLVFKCDPQAQKVTVYANGEELGDIAFRNISYSATGSNFTEFKLTAQKLDVNGAAYIDNIKVSYGADVIAAPETPENPDAPQGPSETGDASIIALAAMMLPASGIGLSALCIKRKKEN